MAFRVLIVDDEMDLRESLVRLLGRFGYICLTAASGAEAIQVIRTGSPNLIVTDLHMPGMDGLAVARYARDERPPIPVILMTAYPTAETRAQTGALGGTLHLGKPFANADLLKAVQDALADA